MFFRDVLMLFFVREVFVFCEKSLCVVALYDHDLTVNSRFLIRDRESKVGLRVNEKLMRDCREQNFIQVPLVTLKVICWSWSL
jgi:hypothetical protein